MTDISIKRKVREIDLAVKLEQIYSKDEILLMYLNTINYGDGCHGIEAAAQHYYSKHSNELTIAQAATLIGIPNSPTLYNPVTNPESSIQRRNVVLSRMLTNGVITEDEYNAAIAEELNLNVAPEEGTNGVYKYEWFTTYVRDLLQNDEYLAKGVTYDKLFEGGLTIVTSLDPTMQEYAEEAVAIQYESGAVKQGQEFALTSRRPEHRIHQGHDRRQELLPRATSLTLRQAPTAVRSALLPRRSPLQTPSRRASIRQPASTAIAAASKSTEHPSITTASKTTAR